jgi:hypothetical protein
MIMKKLILSTAVVATLGAGVNTSTYASLASDAVLNFNPGSPEFGASSGSYFGFDFNGDDTVSSDERIAISQHNGLILGTVQVASGSHDGAIDGSESPDIDNPWSMFSITGMHATSSATTVTSTGVNMADIDFSGWFIDWVANGVTTTGLGGGLASVACAVDCSVNDAYTLDYSAIVDQGDPSVFAGVLYTLHLEGTISAVPVPTAVWLFGSGLIGLMGIARRKKV